MAFMVKNIVAYSYNHVEHTNILCGQNAMLFNVKASGTYNNLCALKS
jgi:hypothetical protein